MREPPPDIPAALVQESAIASDEMKATTGIYDAALGARSNEISGVAIRARENQGGNSALHYQDNLMATLHHLGCALIDLVPKIYDTERTVRILRDDDEHAPVTINVPFIGADGKRVLLNDLTQGAYDVRVKIGPAYSTKRAEAANSMLQFVQAVPQAAAIVGDLVARNMDWPGADEIADRLKRMLPAQVTGDPAQPAPDMQLAAMREQAYREALAQAHLTRVQGQAAKSAADAVKAEAQAHEAAASVFAGQSQASQNPMDIAMKYAALREQEANAAKAEADLQGKAIDNAIKRARFTDPQPYS